MQTASRFFGILAFGVLVAAMVGCASTPTSEGTGGYVNDSIVTANVKAKLLNTPGVDSTEISVETFKGVVKLTGFLDSRDMINTAVLAARSVKGVKSVEDDLTVKGQQGGGSSGVARDSGALAP